MGDSNSQIEAGFQGPAKCSIGFSQKSCNSKYDALINWVVLPITIYTMIQNEFFDLKVSITPANATSSISLDHNLCASGVFWSPE